MFALLLYITQTSHNFVLI